MPSPKFNRIPKTRIALDGIVCTYTENVIDNWLLPAPFANPAMLEMFRDRNAEPFRQMVPWAGEFAGKYLTGAVQVLRVTGNPKLRVHLKDFVGHLLGLQAGDGYFGPWPSKFALSNYASNGGYTWDTWGHYHIMMGLMLWHEETGDKLALAGASRIAGLMCDMYLGVKGGMVVPATSMKLEVALLNTVFIAKSPDDLLCV